MIMLKIMRLIKVIEWVKQKSIVWRSGYEEIHYGA